MSSLAKLEGKAIKFEAEGAKQQTIEPAETGKEAADDEDPDGGRHDFQEFEWQ